jgi:hypothetical protein
MFAGEIVIHLKGIENATKSIVAFPKILICLDCGLADFLLREEELQNLREACSLDDAGNGRFRRQQISGFNE